MVKPRASDELCRLSAIQAHHAIRRGRFTARALVESCLSRISQFEPMVKAWAFLDPERALRQADSIDQRVRTGGDIGPLGGIPVGIKDIFNLSSAGEAPALEDGVCTDTCPIWAFYGMPVLNVPTFKGPSRLPFGLQVVSQRYHDADVLRFAKVLTNFSALCEVIEPVTVSPRPEESSGPRSVYEPAAAS